MSLIMVPPGCGGGKPGAAFARAIDELTKPGNVGAVAREATAWVEQAIAIVRQAAEPNPWKDADDEAIAGEILAMMR